MAFDKNKITQQLVAGFGKIASEATDQNPATKIEKNLNIIIKNLKIIFIFHSFLPK